MKAFRITAVVLIVLATVFTAWVAVWNGLGEDEYYNNMYDNNYYNNGTTAPSNFTGTPYGSY